MDKKKLLAKLEELKGISKKRKFTQTYDLIVNLKNLDLKKPSDKVDFSISFNSKLRDKKFKILAILDHSFSDGEKIFDKVIYNNELTSLKENFKQVKKIAHEYDRFVIQANFMPQFAQIFGRILGSLNKMPSPKLGQIVGPKADLKNLYENLQKSALIQTKKNLVLQVSVGCENEKDETIIENISHFYDVLIQNLPKHENNVKNIKLKLTMSKGVDL